MGRKGWASVDGEYSDRVKAIWQDVLSAIEDICKAWEVEMGFGVEDRDGFCISVPNPH